uniref:Uncharacterized protein n=1 Tax=Peronospora matthiolae TaxID=2874970 RepID=A0AAV1URR7_9STRA
MDGYAHARGLGVNEAVTRGRERACGSEQNEE